MRIALLTKGNGSGITVVADRAHVLHYIDLDMTGKLRTLPMIDLIVSIPVQPPVLL